MRYRVFVGMMWDDGDLEWTKIDLRGLEWGNAKEAIADHLRMFLDDDCGHCRLNAERELERLAVAPPGRFEADADGDDYLILPESE